MLEGQQVGPFLVGRELGSGAMGTVYLARYKDNLRVALKFMAPALGRNEQALARFSREAEILKQLKHPHIVRLFGHGKFKGMPYYAMEFVQGETLESVLARRGRLTWEEVVTLGRQLCDALQHAHQQGIIHRDLKPGNLMILPDGTLKLADFGIAKDLDVTQLTSANCTVGTASYMSPEQCRGERNLSHKSDLYSLGVVFYELLTGKKPFTADNAMDMFLKHCNGTFERPSRLVLDIPIWLDTLVCQLLEKQPDKRPFDAAMVGAALERVAEKVSAQQSAGVDAVKARAIDRLTGAARPGQEDREAARTLAAGLGKGKKKRKAKPVYKRAWFQAIWIVLGLAVVGTLIFVATRPPAPEKLAAEAKRLWDKGDADSRDRAREGPVARYLKLYGDRDDETTRQVRGWADEVDLVRRERSLANRVKLNLEAEDERERAAQSALRHEEAGEFTQAVAGWQKLLPLKAEADRAARIYGLLAEKRLLGLGQVEERYRMLAARADQARTVADFKPESEAEEKALEAVRLEQFGDVGRAYRTWDGLRRKFEKDSDNRAWFLLAARQAQALKEQAPPAADDEAVRQKLVRERLAAAHAYAKAGQVREALLLAREILALYPQYEPVQAEVKQARELAAKLTEPPPVPSSPSP